MAGFLARELRVIGCRMVGDERLKIPGRTSHTLDARRRRPMNAFKCMLSIDLKYIVRSTDSEDVVQIQVAALFAIVLSSVPSF